LEYCFPTSVDKKDFVCLLFFLSSASQKMEELVLTESAVDCCCRCNGCSDIELVCSECKQYLYKWRYWVYAFFIFIGVVCLIVWVVLYKQNVSPYTKLTAQTQSITEEEHLCSEGGKGYCWYGYVTGVYVSSNQEQHSCKLYVPTDYWSRESVHNDVRNRFPVGVSFIVYSRYPQNDDYCIWTIDNPWSWLVAGCILLGLVVLGVLMECISTLSTKRKQQQQQRNKKLRTMTFGHPAYSTRPARSSVHV
jgi:hypothetical protein